MHELYFDEYFSIINSQTYHKLQNHSSFMLFPTSTFFAENKRGNKSAEALNTIKIDFAKMAHIKPSSEAYTECPKCFMLLTIDDISISKTVGSSLNSQNSINSQNSLNSFNNYSSSSSFEEIKMQNKSQKNLNLNEQSVRMSKSNKVEENQCNQNAGWKKTKWYCRYCKEENIVNGQLHYAPNNFKAVIRKNINRNILPPLILFVIDQSASMGQTISVENQSESMSKTKLVKLSKEINEMIKKSHFYNKTKHKEKQEFQKLGLFEEKIEIQKKNEKENKSYYSKITFFMAIIEEYIPKIKLELGTEQFRVGFIFFNESICILKPTYQKTIPVFSPKNMKRAKKKFPFDEKFIDFDDFNSLFKEGKKYDRMFGDCSLKKLDLSKLMFENLEISGRTSLGPALVFALGILSVHDIGSRMIVISDSSPNEGILASRIPSQNEKAYQRISDIIRERQISLGVLSWIEESMKNNVSSFKGHNIEDTINMQFEKFLVGDRTLIQEIKLDFSIGFSQYEVLERVRKTLVGLLKRGSLGKALKVDLRCDSSSIKIQKFKYDHIDFRFMKFLGSCNKNWIQLHTFKIKQSQYLFPIFTQIVIHYEDVFTKQECIFMSYCSHKLLKQIPKHLLDIVANPKADMRLGNNQFEYEYLGSEAYRQQNLDELETLEYINKFDYENVVPEAYSSKMMIMAEENSELDFDKNHDNNWNTLAENMNRLNLSQEEEQDYL